jgi:sugar O-acyltransferase (sialic acid O-acetyltransferase NeuD family)
VTHTETPGVAIIGAGGYGREILEYADDANAQGWGFRVAGFYDDALDARDGHAPGHPVLGPLTAIADSPLRHFIIALGSPETRRMAAGLVAAAGKELVSLVHPRAYVSRSASVGAGTIVCPFGLIGAHSVVGDNVSINVYGSIGHDSVVGRDVVVSPYAAITGTVTLGDESFLGTHVTIMPGLSIGSHSKINAGSVVNRSSPAGSLLAGSPAKGRVMFKVPDADADQR